MTHCNTSHTIDMLVEVVYVYTLYIHTFTNRIWGDQGWPFTFHFQNSSLTQLFLLSWSIKNHKDLIFTRKKCRHMWEERIEIKGSLNMITLFNPILISSLVALIFQSFCVPPQIPISLIMKVFSLLVNLQLCICVCVCVCGYLY